MQIYLVGGAVRDKLLNYPFHERDWVVVGASPEELTKENYRPVGKDFPVFLHPETGEEYALARTERKTGRGYHGFLFHTDPDVTLEQDLIRRDLTINAMAETTNGEIIDPFNGQTDLNNKILRHVSEAFTEDPVRILRTARFAARYHHLGFHIADDTLNLMREMTLSGEADHLVAERVWKEIESALGEKNPQVFFETLQNCGTLNVIFPELENLFGIPQPEQHHPEIDTGIHSLMSLEQAARRTQDTTVRFAALVHDLGKGLTPKEEWPRHIGHERHSEKMIKQLCSRLRVPNHYKELACSVGFYHTQCHTALQLKPRTILKLLNSLDAFRQPEKLDLFLLACEADATGRTGFEDNPYPQSQFLKEMYETASNVTAQPLLKQGVSGKALGEAIQKQRIERISERKEQFNSRPNS